MESKNVEKIVAEAGKVFLRYGFKRTTMADLARAAQMSRPAFYLVFPSKEEAFAAVVSQFMAGKLAEIRLGIPRLRTVTEKLAFAFEVWYVRPFELIQASPDAGDIYENACEIASKALAGAKADYVAIVAGVLNPLVRKQSRIKLSSAKIAEILCHAAHGFKGTANDAKELRQMLSDHLTLVLAGLSDEKTK